MYADSHVDGLLLRPLRPGERLLALAGRGDRVAGAAEGVEEGVPLVVDLVPSVALKGVPQQPPMQLERVAVSLRAEAVQEPRRPFDVREKERHRSGRLLGHRQNYGACGATLLVAGATKKAQYPGLP